MYAQIASEHMPSMVFDTLKFARRAEKVGFTAEQAEFTAEEIASVIDENLATKSEIHELRNEIMKSFSFLDMKFQALENRMIIKVGTMLVAAVGILTTILKLG